MKIIVKISYKGKSYSEDVTEDIEEMREEEDVSEDYIRPIPPTREEDLKKFNGNHFIFGWIENQWQSDYPPAPLVNHQGECIIEVVHEED